MWLLLALLGCLVAGLPVRGDRGLKRLPAGAGRDWFVPLNSLPEGKDSPDAGPAEGSPKVHRWGLNAVDDARLRSSDGMSYGVLAELSRLVFALRHTRGGTPPEVLAALISPGLDNDKVAEVVARAGGPSVVNATPVNIMHFSFAPSSGLLHQMNPGGRLMVFGDAPDTSKHAKKLNGCKPCDVIPVTFWTTVGKQGQDRSALGSERMVLDAAVKAAKRAGIDDGFDIVLVDGPGGYGDSSPGRMQSIATAQRLARAATPDGRGAAAHVLVHDYARAAETMWTNHYFQHSTGGGPGLPAADDEAGVVSPAALEWLVGGGAANKALRGPAGWQFVKDTGKLRHLRSQQ